MSKIILYISSANHPWLQNPCLFLSDAFFMVRQLDQSQSQPVLVRCRMLFAMQTLDINRQQNYMVELTLKILSSSQSPGRGPTIFLQSKPEHEIVLYCDYTGPPPCQSPGFAWRKLRLNN